MDDTEEREYCSESDVAGTDSEPDIPLISEWGKRSHSRPNSTSKRLHMTDDSYDSMDKILSTIVNGKHQSTTQTLKRKGSGLRSKSSTPLSIHTVSSKESSPKAITPNSHQRQGYCRESPLTTSQKKSSLDVTPTRTVSQKCRRLTCSPNTSDVAQLPSPQQKSTTVQPDLATTLTNITTLLDNVVKRMDRIEKELKQHNSTVSSSSASEPDKKTSVPLVVKVSMYMYVEKCFVYL